MINLNIRSFSRFSNFVSQTSCFCRACCRDPWGREDGGWGSRIAGNRVPGSVSVFSQSSSVCFSFNASGQDLVWISDCAKFLENHPPKGIVSVLNQSESFSLFPTLHFYPAICAGMSPFPQGLYYKALSLCCTISQRKAFEYHIFEAHCYYFCFLFIKEIHAYCGKTR